MADILVDESPDIYSVIDQVKEEAKKKELRATDDEEDFLDEGTEEYTLLQEFLSERHIYLISINILAKSIYPEYCGQ